MSIIGSVHFRLENQIAMIKDHGTVVAVSPCLQCPCLREEHQFSPLCLLCQGTGRYYPPSLRYSTTLLLIQEDSERTYQEYGTWVHGTIRASVLPGVHLAERDQVTMVDIRDTFNDEVLVRGLDDQVRFSSGVQLEVVADFDRVYQQGQDYALEAPQTIAWLPNGYAPAFGTQYSVRYSAFPTFLVLNDSPRLRVEHRIPQSQEVLLMRLDKWEASRAT